MSAPLVTFLTDFGLRDGYVAAMKGVLLARCPEARIVDVSHAILPGDVDAAAYVLRQVAGYFAAGTVHLAVVDPGVGSERRALVADTGSRRFVAPDNGLLTLVLDGAADLRMRAIENPALWREPVSPVFHGRDVFAPVGAFLAAGGDWTAVGPEIDPATIVRRPWPPPRSGRGVQQGVIVYVDGFGNMVSNLPVGPGGPGSGEVEVAGRRVPTGRTYSDVAPGDVVAVGGSAGLLEIARRGGNAAEHLGASVGAVITWRSRPEPARRAGPDL